MLYGAGDRESAAPRRSEIMTKNSRHTAVTWAIALAACCLLAVGPVDAQSKKSAKQAESLEEAGESSKVAVRGVLEHLSGMLSGYNSIINGDAKDTQAAYKKLVGDLKAADKKIEGAGKQLASLNKEAEKFFQGWEQDLAGISSEGLREKSASRLETVFTVVSIASAASLYDSPCMSHSTTASR